MFLMKWYNGILRGDFFSNSKHRNKIINKYFLYITDINICNIQQWTILVPSSHQIIQYKAVIGS